MPWARLHHVTLLVMRFSTKGFTLIELMVVVTIMGILAAIVYANISGTSPKARDAERQADLRNLQIAIEQFKLKNGTYPDMGCTPGSDQISTEGDCTTYIADLAPAYISVLPKDTNRGSAAGYGYVTNTDGTSYKVMAVGTVESETVTNTHQMKSCDTTDICNNSCGIGALQASSYALWGGFAGNDGDSVTDVKTATAAVICR
jgi:type II secretion system protein G